MNFVRHSEHIARVAGACLAGSGFDSKPAGPRGGGFHARFTNVYPLRVDVARLRRRQVRDGGNTLNICLGHVPFPQLYQGHIDLMLSPREIQTASRLVVVPDSIYGENGSALSEYAQLFWLYDNLRQVAAGFTFIRIFHYRRFVSPEAPPVGQRSVNQWWSTAIQPLELQHFAAAFSRSVTQEFANTPASFPGGALGQYADAHHLQDILRFTEFLCDRDVFDPKNAA